MSCRLLIFSCLLLLCSCAHENEIDLVVYPEYCGGCVKRNFKVLGIQNYDGKFNIYFDTTDTFILGQARLNDLVYHHIDNGEIRSKFGDYANIVLISAAGERIELRTNETIKKGTHY